MIREATSIGVKFDVSEAFEVDSEGSVFGPDGVEFAAYVESPTQTTRTDLPVRKEIVEGRSYVEEFTHEEGTEDGWLLLFRDEDGLGFELGRQLGGRRIVFWAHRLPDERAREGALAVCRAATV